MDEVLVYFNESGNSGPVASVVEWVALGDWIDTLEAKSHQRLLRVWEQGWEDDLDGLAAELRAALEDDPPEDEDARAAADELLGLVEDRAEGDRALAVTTNTGGG